MVEIKKINCPETRLKLKCPYIMIPSRIVIHNTANDASAESEIAYMHRNLKQTSFHFTVDDTEIVQGIDLNRNAWHAGDGNGKGNREGIAIEICYSKSGGERFEKAQKNAAELTASLLEQYGWGIDRVTKHQDYSKKNCPHRTLSDYGWDYFLNLVKTSLEQLKNPSTTTQTPPDSTPTSAAEKNRVTYQAWDNIHKKWLPNVIDKSDYAGIYGNAVAGILASLDSGNIYYKVHLKSGTWLPEVKNREDFAGILGKPIDALAMQTDTGMTLYYAVHLQKDNRWLPFVSGCDINNENSGYAGIIGQEIDAIQMYLI